MIEAFALSLLQQAWGFFTYAVFGLVPTWVLVAAGGVALGYLFKKFGWQGVVGGVIAIGAMLIYQQGYKDGLARVQKKLPSIAVKPTAPAPKPVKKKKYLLDYFKRDS